MSSLPVRKISAI